MVIADLKSSVKARVSAEAGADRRAGVEALICEAGASSVSPRYIGVMTHLITRGVDARSASGAISDASSLNQPLSVILLDKEVRLHASILTSRRRYQPT